MLEDLHDKCVDPYPVDTQHIQSDRRQPPYNDLLQQGMRSVFGLTGRTSLTITSIP